jgi:hypothetical protein
MAIGPLPLSKSAIISSNFEDEMITSGTPARGVSKAVVIK